MGIVNLIKRALSTLGVVDSGNFQKAQVTYNEKVKTIHVIHDYGFTSSAPIGGNALLFNVNGHEENITGIIDAPPADRLKDLKTGECVVYNIVTGTYIKQDSDGNIVIEANNKTTITCNIVIITAPSTTIDGNLTVSTGATGTITSSSVATVSNGIITNIV